MSVKELPLPDFYEPKTAHEAAHHVPDAWQLQLKADEWAQRYKLAPAGADAKRIVLLDIDQQIDFSHQEGTLFVGGHTGVGAMEDQRRLVEFAYRNLGVISEIICSMDSHLPYQIFFPSAHLRADGSRPGPFTIISADEYRGGLYRPDPRMAAQLGLDPVTLQKQFIHYCCELERLGRYQLTLWPYHTEIGSNGHRLSGVVDELRLFHAFARGAKNQPEIKGGNPLTEHYSIFAPEVTTLFDGSPIPGAQKNTRLISTLMNADVVIIAGEAGSHCVAWTIEDLMNEFSAVDRRLLQKVYILEDCTSPVVIPGVRDYTPEQEAALNKFRGGGMNVVKSTDPIDSWPGINL